MQNYWSKTPENIWQGRDHSTESPLAKRIFQTIEQPSSFCPQSYSNKIALLGFMCDEGVRINKGRIGAKNAPNNIRQALANLASHGGTNQLVDLGNITYDNGSLTDIQRVFTDHVVKCQTNNLVTLVLGGGHETAYAHGLGIYEAHPEATIGIINFDAHLDIRTAQNTSSGTPFKQLADYCETSNRPFNYMCIGANLAANTEALLQTAKELNVDIVWDTECSEINLSNIISKIEDFIKKVDIVYLTIDLDVLPTHTMFAVSAPSALGVEMRILLALAHFITQSKKLKAVDLVEYNPDLDPQHLCAKVAARFAWQISHDWQQ